MGNNRTILLTQNEGVIDDEMVRGFQDYIQRHQLPWRPVICDKKSIAHASRQMQNVGSAPSAIVGMLRHQDPVTEWVGTSVPIASCSSNPHEATSVHVVMDEEAIIKVALDHFMHHGLRHVASVEVQQYGAVASRQQAFTTAARQAGLGVHIYTPKPDYGADPEAALAAWLAQQRFPVGVLCHNDDSAVWLARHCAVHGFAVPDQICILGIDNNSRRCEAASPTLSSIILPWRQAGSALAEGLQRYWSGQPVPIRSLCMPRAVKQRASTGGVQTGQDRDMQRAKTMLITKGGRFNKVAVVASRLGMGRRTLVQRFQKTFGCSPKEWQQDQRLQRAREALVLTDRPIVAIAGDLGFANYRQFSTIFRERVGMSPRTYRNGDVRWE